jgi:hypothetical protein
MSDNTEMNNTWKGAYYIYGSEQLEPDFGEFVNYL